MTTQCFGQRNYCSTQRNSVDKLPLPSQTNVKNKGMSVFIGN